MAILPTAPDSETIRNSDGSRALRLEDLSGDTFQEKTVAADIQHAHQLLDQLGPDKLEAVLRLLEVMVESDGDESLSGDDHEAVATSREYFRRNPGGGVPFEQVIADLGFTMDRVREFKND